MARRHTITADVIAGLRQQVAAHNEHNPGARTRLNDLKKVFQSHGPAGVSSHLTVLAKASGDFDENKHRRDGDGRFAPKPGGQGSSYGDVASPSQHRQLVAENEGYRAANTQVIQETRGTTYGPYVGVAAGLAAGAVTGAGALRNPAGGAVRRFIRRKAGDIASGTVGGTTAAAIRTGGAVARAVSGKPDKGAAHVAAERIGRKAGGGARRLVEGTFSLSDRAVRFLPRAAIKGEMARAPLPKTTAEVAARRLRAYTKGARWGLLTPGIGYAAVGYYGMRDVGGPLYDATFPRRVEKAATAPADPRSVEILAKAASLPGAARALGQRFRSLISRAPAAAATTGRAAREQRLSALGRSAAKTRLRQAGSYGAAGYGLAAAGGAAAGAATGAVGVAGERRFYRDKDGKFTSKERDVGDRLTTGEKAAVGGLAAAGALLAVRGIRGKNAAVARRVLEGLKGSTIQTTKGPGNAEVAARLLAPAKQRARFTPSEGAPTTSVKTPAGRERIVGDADSLLPGEPTSQTPKFGDRLVLMRQRAMHRARTAVEFSRKEEAARATQRVERRLAPVAAAFNANNPVTWAHWAADDALRGRLRHLASASNKEGQALLQGLSEPQKKAVRSVLRGEMKFSADGKVVSDPVGALMSGQYDGIMTGGKNPTAVKLPAQFVARLNAMRTQVTTAKTDYEKAVSALRTRRDEAVRANRAAMKEHDDKFAELRGRKEVLDAHEKGKDILPKPAAYKAATTKLENEVKQLAEARDKAAQDVLDAGEAMGKMPRAADPFSPGHFLPDRPESPAALGEIKARMVKEEMRGIQDAVARETGKAAEAVDIAANAARQVYQRAARGARDKAPRPPGPPTRTRALLDRAGRPLREAAVDARRLGGDVAEAVRARLPAARAAGAKAATTARDAGRKATAGLRWAKEHGATIALAGGAATAAATTLGLADAADDGEVNFRFDRAKKIPSHLVDSKTRPRPVFNLLNPGLDSEVRLSMMVAPNMSGERIVISGYRFLKDKDGRRIKQEIPAGSRVKDVIADTRSIAASRRQGGQQQGGGAKAAIGGSEDQRKAWATALGMARGKSDVRKVDELGDDAFEYRAGQTNSEATVQQDAEKLKNHLLDEAKNARDGQSMKPREWYATAAKLFDSDESPLLNPKQQHAVLMGTADKPGLLSTATRDSYGIDKAKFAGNLGRELSSIPPPRDEAQARTLRQIVGFYQHIGPLENMRLNPAEAGTLRSALDKRSSGAGTPKPREAAAPAAPNLRTDPRGKTTVDFDHATSRKDAGAAIFSVLVEQDRLPGNQMLASHVEAALKRTEADYRKEHGDPKPGREGAWWADVENEALRRVRVRGAEVKKLAGVSGELLRKSAEQGFGGGPGRFDEQKHRRNPRGSDGGGKFAPKDGAAAARAPRQPAGDNRSFFEPVRLGGMAGGALGGMAAWELAARYLPKPLRTAATIARMASRMGAVIGPRTGRAMGSVAGRAFVGTARAPGVLAATIAGGVGGQLAGENIGASTYAVRGRKAPGSYEEPERSAGEDMARLGGGLSGQTVAAIASKSALRGTVYGAIASLGAEELAGRAYQAARLRYGDEIASKIHRGALPTSHGASA